MRYSPSDDFPPAGVIKEIPGLDGGQGKYTMPPIPFEDARTVEVLAVTPASVRGEVQRIRNVARDPETAHLMEDTLYVRILECLRDGTIDDPAECAREALTVREMDFARWYA